MGKGKLALLLHAHLPFIHHPEHDTFLEEKWFFEAMTETYLPLVALFDEMEQRGVLWRLTMSVTPPLAEMMVTHSLRAKYSSHLDRLLTLAEKEVTTKAGTAFEAAARDNLDTLEKLRYVYRDKWNGDLIAAFRHHQDAGSLEVITCAATHGFLPFIFNDKARYAQIAVGVKNYRKHFGRDPRGIWLPECAYSEEIEKDLRACGIDYFFLDAHGLVYADPFPAMGMARPVNTPGGLVALGRDIESSKSVWSAEEGYPGDGVYREFYRDLGYDAPLELVQDFMPDGVRRDIGLKYHKITGDVALQDKQPYDPDAARRRAYEHAGNFLFNRQQQVRHLSNFFGRPPMILSPYDAELFGHWWYEGPIFLRAIFEKAGDFADAFELATVAEAVKDTPPLETVRPSTSSWGDKGYFEVWLGGTNDWVYPHFHSAEDRMVELADKFRDPGPLDRRALNQAARELLLAESSDWAFIMSNQSTVPYAHNRVKTHLGNFNRLYEELSSGSVDDENLARLEWKNPAFQEISYTVYRGGLV